MSVTLLDVWRAARVRSVPFSGESAGYVALALCEATTASPRLLGLADAELGPDGALRPIAGPSCSAEHAERELRTLLGKLLEVASSPGPALWRAAARGAAGGHALSLELEKALIPLNRAAARRALLRLFRETERAVQAGRLGALPDVDDAGLLRLSPSPAPVVHAPPAVLEVRSVPPPVATALAPNVPAAQTPRPARASVPPPLPAIEQEHVTSPETVVARRARGVPSPPPLPVLEVIRNTPRIGSVDVAVISVEVPRRAPYSAYEGEDATERVPEVEEFEPEDGVDLNALADWPVSESRLPIRVVTVPEADLESEPMASLSATADVDEPSTLPEESPALVVGVHVADSDELAETVHDDELETRPLPSALVASPPPGPVVHLRAKESDVRELLSGFQVAGGMAETELRRELKALAGVDLTPGSAVPVQPR